MNYYLEIVGSCIRLSRDVVVRVGYNSTRSAGGMLFSTVVYVAMAMCKVSNWWCAISTHCLVG